MTPTKHDLAIVTADAPLDPQDLARLRKLAEGRTKAQLAELVSGVGAKAMVAALAGLPVRAATRELIRQHLAAKLASDMNVINRSLAKRGLMVDREAVAKGLAAVRAKERP